jgi:hypothetical protein
MTTLGMWIAFTWNIPVDNQIGMFILSCLCLSLMSLVAFEDIKELVKSRKLKPQKF